MYYSEFNIDYSWCDSLVPNEEPFKEVHYEVNLLHSHEMEYRANLSNQDRAIGGKHLALANGGTNGLIIGLDMKILYFNSDGKQVSIGITGGSNSGIFSITLTDFDRSTAASIK